MPINTTVQLCGARAKQNNHKPCRQPAIKNKVRCRLHGGLSTGPKTPEGKKRSAITNLKFGHYTKEAIAERNKFRMMMDWRKDIDDF